MSYSQADSEVGIMNVSTLHVCEKLFSKVILKVMSSFGQVFQRETVFCKLSHNSDWLKKLCKIIENLSDRQIIRGNS